LESIIQIRQMMAEEKFFEAQKQIEIHLSMGTETRHELLQLYAQCLDYQKKDLPHLFRIELAEKEISFQNFESASRLLSGVEEKRYFQKISQLKMIMSEKKGEMEKLHQLISEYLFTQFENQIPFIPDFIQSMTERYFKNDFGIKLKVLALTILLNDRVKAEELIFELITSAFEKSSPKGINERLNSIAEVIALSEKKGTLEIYQSYCSIYVDGIQEKSQYKKLIEMILYFEDFKLQTLLLHLIHNLGYVEEAREFSVILRAHKNYDFVYFDKYFPHLKEYFVQKRSLDEQVVSDENHFGDITKIDKSIATEMLSAITEIEPIEGEGELLSVLKFQSYSTEELLDISTGFLQSGFPGAALKASELALSKASDDSSFLKASYLKLTCQLQLQDYRAALDTCLESLGKTKTEDDVLSFLYGQAEALIRLGQNKQAKKILSRILKIDSNYRMAKERMERL
jgi:hypothetical protein